MQDCVGEEERLRQLAELAIVDAPIDPLMDRICLLASGLLAMPMAFVTMVDATMTHVKAHQGLGYVSLAREDTFCNVAIRHDEPFVVRDLAADPRFWDSPLVTGDPFFRFYAGVPLSISPGVRVGALCVGDHVPRDLRPEQIECLQNLAALVIGQIRHHTSRQELARLAIDLTRKQDILTQTAKLARVGGFELDGDTSTMMLSDELMRLYAGKSSRTIVFERFLRLFAPTEQARLRQGFARLSASDEIFDVETRILDLDGLPLDVRLHAEAQMTNGARKVVGIVQDITERKAVIGKLEWLASHDGLTKVRNRASFTTHIEAAIRKADMNGRRAALIVLDVDRFKTINDTLGHDAGDAVLVAVAERLVVAVGRRGTVARLGGDEFGILVEEIEAEGVVATLAADILRALRRPLEFGSHELSTRATFGVALSEIDESSAQTLIKDADIALYEAKKAGRDGFALFRDQMRVELEDRVGRLAAARAIIAAGRVEPWYQPKIDLVTGTVVGFEALLRCVHPVDGLQGPEMMTEAFGDRELAVAISHQMRERIAADMRDWGQRGIAFGHVAINAAEAEFQGDDYAERMSAWLAMNDFSPALLQVEITESVFLGHQSSKVATALRRLSAAGIAIALDDFGTGYASLTHLARHPVDWIKIDRSFVSDIASSRKAATIVEALAALARSLQLGIVAEGVETPAQLEVLREHGCTVGQGYLFAKPMPGSRVSHFMRGWLEPRAGLELRATG